MDIDKQSKLYIQLEPWLNSPLLSQRYVFSAAMLMLAISGLGMIFINTMSKINLELRQIAITKGLWRFEPQSSKDVIIREQRRGWYKLLCAGMMLAALSISIIVRFVHALFAILVGVTILMLYVAYLWYYWYFVLTVDDKSKSATSAKSTDSKPSNSDGTWATRYKAKDAEDNRLPVTIVTGFLGSGKTTLIKNMLNNTEGLKILVIENEIGSEGIDHELLMQQVNKEDIILMNNGCICCTGACSNCLLHSMLQY